MKMTDASRTADPAFTNKSTTSGTGDPSGLRLRLVLRCACLAAATIALMVSSVSNSSAAQPDEIDFTWIGGSAFWATPSQWTTNLYDWSNTVTSVSTCRPTNYVDEVMTNQIVCPPGGTGGFPGMGPNPGQQTAFFTNAATYTVTLNGNLVTASNVFATASNTTANVTLDLDSWQSELTQPLEVGTKLDSTTTLTIRNAANLKLNEGSHIGVHGTATVILESGTIDNGSGGFTMGSGDGGRGILIISGPTARLEPNSQISVGGDPQQLPQGSMLIVTNGGRAFSQSSFRVGSVAAKGGSSNNTVIICAGSTLQCDTGPEVIGLRSTGVTNSDGGTLCFNNVMLVKSGGIWACANTSSHSVCVGDAGMFGLSQSGTSSPPAICTGNVLRVEQYGIVTGASTFWIGPTNTVDLQGAFLDANTISNFGTMIAYGTHEGEERIFDGGKLKTRNSLGKLVISNGLWMVTNSILEVEVGDSTVLNPTEVYFRGATNRLEINRATLNIVDVGGMANRSSYDLITFPTNQPPGPPPGFGVGTNAWGFTNYVGFTTITGPAPYTYSVVVTTDTVGRIQLKIGGIVPFRIVSATKSGSNIILTWTDVAGKTDVVQSTTGVGGNYSTNGFTDLSGNIITPASTTNAYTHVGGATGSATRYYRIRRLP